MFKNWKTIKEIKKLKKTPVRTEFLFSLRDHLLHQMEYLPAPEPSQTYPSFKYAFVFALILLIIFGTTGVAFAKESLPGDLLYPVKLLTEDIKENLISDLNKKNAFRENRIDRRLEEMEKLLEKGKDGQLLTLLENHINKYLDLILDDEFSEISKMFEEVSS